jgi:hypothetical protein
MMRRRVVLGPLVLYTAGCALRPFTPAVSVAVYGQDALPTVGVATVPARADAIARWQLPPDNPWAAYQKLTLLASLDQVPRTAILPDVAHLEVVDDARTAAIRVAAAGLPQSTMWVVDLRGAASVVFGALLSRRTATPPSLVPTFNNWPADDELIPAEETLAALVLATPHPPDPSAVTHLPIFLLDAWRLAYRLETPSYEVTDNRYMLTPTDLPSAEVLQKQGIRRIVYLVEDLDDTDTEEDDLNTSFLAYQAVGITISMIDLKTLADAAPALDDELTARRFRVKERITVVDDPAFYARAQGGFGGARVGPSPFAPESTGGGPAFFGGGGYSFGGGG